MRTLVRVIAALAALAGLTACGGVSAQALGPHRPVVLLLTAGLTWDDISDTTQVPNALAANGAIAALVPRSVASRACPIDGALALSAGRRADAARDPDGGCLPPRVVVAAPGGPGTVQDWAGYAQRAADASADARLGTLGDALADAGRSSAAVGPLATLALARADGTADQTWAGPDQLSQAVATRTDLLIVDLPQITAPAAGTPAEPSSREQQVAALDAALVNTLNALPGDATILVASIADAPIPDASSAAERLQLAAAVAPPGGGIGPALLYSPSTRHEGLILTTDLLPTVLTLLDVEVPRDVDGGSLRVVAPGGSEADRLEYLLDLQADSAGWQRLRIPFFVTLLGSFAVLAGAGAIWLRRSRIRSAALLVQVAGLAAASVPTASVLVALVPWWRATQPGLALIGSGLVVVALVTTAALAGPWRRHALGPPAVVGALTAATLSLDAAAGSPLTLVTAMGGDPLVGGRFYGFHNPLFAAFASAVVWLGLGLATLADRAGRRRWAPAVLIALGVIASVINLLPQLGADVGGPPALLPAMALLALRAGGIRLTWARGALIAAATAALLVAVFVADWLRPVDQRTHLGAFVATLIEGEGWIVVRRKVAQNLDILTSSPATMAIPVLAVLVIWALARPRRFGLSWVEAAYRRHWLLADALVALAVVAVLGFAANDSGTSIPPVVALVSLPLLLSVCALTVPATTTPRPR